MNPKPALLEILVIRVFQAFKKEFFGLKENQYLRIKACENSLFLFKKFFDVLGKNVLR
jgi:hypothetical protein